METDKESYRFRYSSAIAETLNRAGEQSRRAKPDADADTPTMQRRLLA